MTAILTPPSPIGASPTALPVIKCKLYVRNHPHESTHKGGIYWTFHSSCDARVTHTLVSASLYIGNFPVKTIGPKVLAAYSRKSSGSIGYFPCISNYWQGSAAMLFTRPRYVPSYIEGYSPQVYVRCK